MTNRHVLRAPAATLLALLFLTACTPEPEVFSIGSGGSLGNYYSAARAIARVVNKAQDENGFRLEHVPSEGSIANINAILAGTMPFGLAQADRQYQAVHGEGAWSGAGPQAGLRAVFSLYTDAITVVATPASGVRNAGDLVGKRIDIGHPDSGIRQNALDALDAIGTDWRTRTTIHGETPDDRASMYLKGELDAFFHTVGHPTTDITFAVNSVPRARLVPLVNIEKLLADHPYYSRARIPVALYPGIDNEEDVDTVGVKVVFLTSADVDADVVYAITKAVFENVEQLGQHDPVMKYLSAPRMLGGMIAPIHPGAQRYFDEAGLRPGT